MYIIEMHYLKRAFAQIVLEKQDGDKTYEEFSNYRVITNHAGDVQEASCKWCAIRRRAELLRERRNTGF